METKSWNPLLWGVNCRPQPRAVQALVIVAVVVPAACAGLVAWAVADVLTVNWPTGEPR